MKSGLSKSDTVRVDRVTEVCVTAGNDSVARDAFAAGTVVDVATSGVTTIEDAMVVGTSPLFGDATVVKNKTWEWKRS